MKHADGFRSVSQQLAGTMFAAATQPTTRAHASPASHAAATAATRKAPQWARLALALYVSGLEMTPDEVSDRIDWQHERSIKPRVSNLLRKGWLEVTGERRAFDNGKAQRGPGDVLRVTAAGRREYGA